MKVMFFGQDRDSGGAILLEGARDFRCGRFRPNVTLRWRGPLELCNHRELALSSTDCCAQCERLRIFPHRARPLCQFGKRYSFLRARNLRALALDNLSEEIRVHSHLFVALISSSSFDCAAPLSMLSSANRVAFLKSCAAPPTTSAAAALMTTKSRASSRHPPENIELMIAALFSASLSRTFSSVADFKPKSSGVISKLRTSPFRVSATSVFPLKVTSSSPSEPWTTHACSVPSAANVCASGST